MSDDPQKESEPNGTTEADAAPGAPDDPIDGSAVGISANPEGTGDGPAVPTPAVAAPAAGGAVEAPVASESQETPPASTPVSALAQFRPSYIFLVVVTLVNLGADLWSKHWAKSTFEAAHPAAMRKLVVIEDYVNLIYAKNRGGAWGLLQNETEALRRPFFLVVSVAAIVFIVSLYRKLAPDQRALKWGLPLVLGGALGNLVDRIRYGFVVDFIDVYTTVSGQVKHWPTFNVADISICIGVGLMAIDMFTPRSKKAKEAAAKVPEAKASEAKAIPGVAAAEDGALSASPDSPSTTAPDLPQDEPAAAGDSAPNEIPASSPPVQGT